MASVVSLDGLPTVFLKVYHRRKDACPHEKQNSQARGGVSDGLGVLAQHYPEAWLGDSMAKFFRRRRMAEAMFQHGQGLLIGPHE